METSKPVETFRNDAAHIGKSVVIKGQLSGSENLYLDGEIEGSIELAGHSLTIGPNGRVKANLNGRDVVIHGKVDGNIHASARVELKRSAVVVGDIVTQRITIEEGAYFKGGVDIQKAEAKPEVKGEAKAEARSEAKPPEVKPEVRRDAMAAASGSYKPSASGAVFSETAEQKK